MNLNNLTIRAKFVGAFGGVVLMMIALNQTIWIGLGGFMK